ncbi:MAG: type II methionyl aminopeptidase [Promethearchaeota archaeon]
MMVAKKSSKKAAKKVKGTGTKKTAKKTAKKVAKKTAKKTAKKVAKKTAKKAGKAEPGEEKIESTATGEEPNDEDEKEKRIAAYRKAGEIHKQVKEFIRPQVVVGARLIDLCEKIEDKIVELGGGIGFPANISINHHAAHYTSPPKDERVIEEGDVVKVDIGVHVDGYLADSAFTVNLSTIEESKNLGVAAEEAVKNAIAAMKPGAMTNEIGKIIEDTVKKYGYRPIKELSGHLVDQWVVHAEKRLPNLGSPHGEPIEEGEVWAVEVFASTGEGSIHESPNGYIYSINPLAGRVPLRSKAAKKILGIVGNEFKTLPFSLRWITKKVKTARFGILELVRSGKLEEYKVLSEDKGYFVGQHEETVLITADGCEQLS